MNPEEGGGGDGRGEAGLLRSGAVLLWSTALAFPLAVGTLALAGLEVVHALYMGGLLVLLPGLAAAQVPLVGEEPLERAPVYVGSGLVLVLLAGLSYLLGAMAVGDEGLGMAPFLGALPLVAWAGGLVAAAVLVFLAFHLLGLALEIPESPILALLLPRTARERTLFACLALAAGVGEELAYRGYAITLLAPLLGSPWWAAALTSALFGGLHAYQGALGILRAAALGFVLATGFLLSGSLWPAIVAHSVIDLLGGLVLGDRLLRRP